MDFDREAALTACGGDESLRREVAVEWVRTLPSQREEVRLAVGSGDAKAVARAAHRVRSALWAVGAVAAARAAADLERAARAADRPLAPLHARLEDFLSRAAAEIETSIAG